MADMAVFSVDKRERDVQAESIADPVLKIQRIPLVEGPNLIMMAFWRVPT